MPEKRKIKKKKANEELVKEIKKIVSGLYYMSETDSEIFPFTGCKTNFVTKEIVLAETGSKPDSVVEERNFEEFFSRLTEMQDWFGDEEREAAMKFSRLEELLKENLSDLKVFKVGEIELDVCVVGLDSDNVLTGIKTKAVET